MFWAAGSSPAFSGTPYPEPYAIWSGNDSHISIDAVRTFMFFDVEDVGGETNAKLNIRRWRENVSF